MNHNGFRVAHVVLFVAGCSSIQPAARQTPQLDVDRESAVDGVKGDGGSQVTPARAGVETPSRTKRGLFFAVVDAGLASSANAGKLQIAGRGVPPSIFVAVGTHGVVGTARILSPNGELCRPANTLPFPFPESCSILWELDGDATPKAGEVVLVATDGRRDESQWAVVDIPESSFPLPSLAQGLDPDYRPSRWMARVRVSLGPTGLFQVETAECPGSISHIPFAVRLLQRAEEEEEEEEWGLFYSWAPCPYEQLGGEFADLGGCTEISPI